MARNNKENEIKKIQSKLNEIEPPAIFSSYSELCRFFEIVAPTNQHRIDAKKELFKKFMEIEEFKPKIRIKITKVYAIENPNIDEQFLSSPYYPICTFLLLKYLNCLSEQIDSEEV